MKDIDALNRLACEQGQDTYLDPASGYQVLTGEALRRRGKCCGNSCRHCPYGPINVGNPDRAQLHITRPVLMNWIPKEGALDVLFWSGGKDSFLALMHLLEEKRNVILLTSFGALTRRVSIQDIHIKDIAKQSEFFSVPLCLVPLYPNTDYKQSVEGTLDMIRRETGREIERLVFGDLHLKDIRQWRVNTWSEYEVSTPLFEVPYDQLLTRLWRLTGEMNLSIRLSTEVILPHGSIGIGTAYSPELVNQLISLGVDPMLEHGEGHTMVFPHSWTGC